MKNTILDWDSPAEEASKKKAVAVRTGKRPSLETLKRINFRRDEIKSLTFRPVLKPYLYHEYWNVDDPTNIRYGDNYYIVNDYYGRNLERLRELGYPTESPCKMRMRAIIAFLIIDRADNEIKILEMPWGASFLMGEFARKYGKELGSNKGVDFTVTNLSDDNVEKYAVDADSAESTPFTADEKTRIKKLMENRIDAMAHLYDNRLVDIIPMLKGLDIDPFEEKVEEPEVEQPRQEIIITVPSMDDDKYKPFMESTPDDVLKNLRILVNSKEYDRFLSPDLTEQERVNMDIFMIRSEMELEFRQNGLPFIQRFIDKIGKSYCDIVDSIDTNDFEIKTNLI